MDVIACAIGGVTFWSFCFLCSGSAVARAGNPAPCRLYGLRSAFGLLLWLFSMRIHNDMASEINC